VSTKPVAGDTGPFWLADSRVADLGKRGAPAGAFRRFLRSAILTPKSETELARTASVASKSRRRIGCRYRRNYAATAGASIGTLPLTARAGRGSTAGGRRVDKAATE